jgi:hypothetical protein
LIFSEPNPLIVKNPDGVEVPFAASDIKALLIYHTASVRKRQKMKTYSVGLN